MQNEGSLSLSGDQLDSLWLEVCQELLPLSSPLLINAWAKTSQLQQIEDFADGKWLCTFACPSSFNALQFEKNLSSVVKNLLSQKLGRPIELKFVFNQIKSPPSLVNSINSNSTITQSPVSPNLENNLINNNLKDL